MSTDDYITFSAYAQEYFQSVCGCPDTSGIEQAIQNVIITATARIVLYTWSITESVISWMSKQSPDAHNTPVKGTPNSVKVFDKSKPGSPGRTVRVYGSGGRAVRDIDYDNQAHSGNNPEVHDWT